MLTSRATPRHHETKLTGVLAINTDNRLSPISYFPPRDRVSADFRPSGRGDRAAWFSDSTRRLALVGETGRPCPEMTLMPRDRVNTGMRKGHPLPEVGLDGQRGGTEVGPHKFVEESGK
jgi:hypothetical protein